MSVMDALPAYHHHERHSVHVRASPARTLSAAREVRVDDVPLVRALFRLRGLGRERRGPIWDVLRSLGFRPLGDDTVVAVGRPWSPRGGLRAVDDFVAFDEPGYAKVALGLSAVPERDGTRLETETRIFLTDRASRLRFAAYWLVVRPFSGLVRREWLRAARRLAEAS